ncbi:hypothetical protein [Pseudonocardia sp. SCN 73-27]|uniref:hypothetical protein n=1 Tax=Pseudonocardia sp. SCN 73-27 TaxID=1660132 RepID=UPI0025D6C117|nr:hypothetical protein [Pseudonocardia sp. SCN 73-27]
MQVAGDAAAFGVCGLGDAGAGGPQLGDEALPVERDGDDPADGVDVCGVGDVDGVVADRGDIGAVEDDAGVGRAGVGGLPGGVDVGVLHAEQDACVGVADGFGDGVADGLGVAVAAGEPEPQVLQRRSAREAAAQHAEGEREGDQPDRDDLTGRDRGQADAEQRRQHVRGEDDVEDGQDPEGVQGREGASLGPGGAPEPVHEQRGRREDQRDRPECLDLPEDRDDGGRVGDPERRRRFQQVLHQVGADHQQVTGRREGARRSPGEPSCREGEQQVQDHRDRGEGEHEPDRAQQDDAGQLEPGEVHDDARADQQRTHPVGGPAVPGQQAGTDVGGADDRVQGSVPGRSDRAADRDDGLGDREGDGGHRQKDQGRPDSRPSGSASERTCGRSVHCGRV